MSKELTLLEALERLKVTFNSLIESNEFVNSDISIIETVLKALEIIKSVVRKDSILNKLNEWLKIGAIDKEKYDLLKEVLL